MYEEDKGSSPFSGELGGRPRKGANGMVVCKGYFDGASRGNPGPSGAGAWIEGPDGNCLWEAACPLGVRTNNEAEYEALLLLLEEVARRGLKELLVLGDSRLVICQMQGVWKIREERLRELADRARRLVRGRFVRYEWIPRERNARADRLSNRALDESGGGAGKTSSVSPEKSGLAVPEWLEPLEAPGEKPAADGGEPVVLESVEPHIYLARGSETYAVDTLHRACTCRGFLFRKACRHLRAALEREAAETRAAATPPEISVSGDVETPSR